MNRLLVLSFIVTSCLFADPMPKPLKHMERLIEKTSQYEEENYSIEDILNAKRQWVEMQDSQGKYFDLQDLKDNPNYPGLQKMVQLAKRQGPEIDAKLNQQLLELHEQDVGERKEILIQGAGPNGLLAAIKLYLAGSKVTLVNKRSEIYTRLHIVGLDPKWVADLQWYLGSDFDRLLEEGYATLTPEGAFQVNINQLETALKKRLVKMRSYAQSIYGKDYADLKLYYESEAKEILSPVQPGSKFVAKVDERTIPFDLYVFAGGMKDPMRDRYLVTPKQRTERRDYAVAIWEKKNPTTPPNSAPHYSGHIPVKKYADLLNRTKEDMKEDLKKYDAFSDKAKHRMEKAIERIDWGESFEYRRFENEHYYYGAIVLPQSLQRVRVKLEKSQNFARSEKEKEALIGYLNDFDLHISDAIAKFLDFDLTHAELSKKSSHSFTVVQQAVDQPLKKLSENGSTAILIVIGDDLVSPHFFTGTGLTSGRQSVINLVRAVRRLQDGEKLEIDVLDKLIRKHHEVVDYALKKGEKYVSRK